MANIQPVHSPCYCINYRRAANTLTKYYDAAFAPIGLTGNQFFLLNSIQQLGSCNKSELAQYTSLDRTTIIRNLNTLEKKELRQPPQQCHPAQRDWQQGFYGRSWYLAEAAGGGTASAGRGQPAHPMGSVPPHRGIGGSDPVTF